MSYGGRPTAREIITARLEDGSLEAMFNAADTEKSIMEALGICQPTWLQLKKEIPSFAMLSTRSRKQKFLELKNAMLKNALGYEYTETETETDKEGKLVKKFEFNKHKAPDLNSQRIMMTNIKIAEANQANPDPEITGWSNRMEDAIEIKTDGSIQLTMDSAVQSVLEALSGN